MAECDALDGAAAVPPPPVPCSPQAGGREAAAQLLERRGVNAIFVKTRYCRFHGMGLCTRGDSCHFAHFKEERRPLPNLRCTKLCPNLGSCDKRSCRFAHDRDELRTLEQNSSAARPKFCTEATLRPLGGGRKLGASAFSSSDSTALGSLDFEVLSAARSSSAGTESPSPALPIPAASVETPTRTGAASAHPWEAAVTPADVHDDSDGLTRYGPSVFSRTKMCKFYLAGKCVKQDECNFAHRKSDLRPAPDTSRNTMCPRLVKEGRCHIKGCRYVHDRERLRCLSGKRGEFAPRPWQEIVSTPTVPDTDIQMNHAKGGQSLQDEQQQQEPQQKVVQPATCFPEPLHKDMPSSQDSVLPEQPQMAKMFVVPIPTLLVMSQPAMQPHTLQPILHPYGVALPIMQASSPIQSANIMPLCSPAQQTPPLQHQHFSADQEQQLGQCTQGQVLAQCQAVPALPRPPPSTEPPRMQQWQQQQQASCMGQRQSSHAGSIGCQPLTQDADCFDGSKSMGNLSVWSRSTTPGDELSGAESTTGSTFDEHDEVNGENPALIWADMLDDEKDVGHNVCIRNAVLDMRSFSSDLEGAHAKPEPNTFGGDVGFGDLV